MYVIYAIGLIFTFIYCTYMFRHEPEWDASIGTMVLSALWPAAWIVVAFILVGGVIFMIFQFFHRLIRSFIE